MPRARAPSIVAIWSAVRADSARGSIVCSLGKKRRLAHRLEHVEVVVARRAIGAQSDGDAGLAHEATGPWLHRSRASCCFPDCAPRHLPPREQAPMSAGDRARRRGRPASRSPEADQTQGPPPVSPCVASVRSAISSDVSARWMITGARVAIGQRANGLERGRVERVHRVRRERRHDQLVALTNALMNASARAIPSRRASSRRRRETG